MIANIKSFTILSSTNDTISIFSSQLNSACHSQNTVQDPRLRIFQRWSVHLLAGLLLQVHTSPSTNPSLPLASVGVVSASPLLGFGAPPATPLPIIDFHGVWDSSIPYDVAYGAGRGPGGLVETIMSSDGMYYYDKEQVGGGWGHGAVPGPPHHLLGLWRGLHLLHLHGRCGGLGVHLQVLHHPLLILCRACGDGSVVRCRGQYEHGYPFTWDKVQGSRWATEGERCPGSSGTSWRRRRGGRHRQEGARSR